MFTFEFHLSLLMLPQGHDPFTSVAIMNNNLIGQSVPQIQIFLVSE